MCSSDHHSIDLGIELMHVTSSEADANRGLLDSMGVTGV